MSKACAARAATGIVLLSLLAGCATAPTTHRDPRDPWEGFNRGMYKFNDFFVRKVAFPVGHAYQFVTPNFMQTGINHFFDNSTYPAVIVNDFLQFKVKKGFNDTGRFLLNTTVGLAGILDPATPAGLARGDNDFGRTLGTWGIPSGPYLVLPFYGPSDIRDTVGRVPDGYLWPLAYLKDPYAKWGSYALYLIDTDVHTLMPAYTLLDQQNPFDKYAFMRNVYLQRREYLIHGASAPAEDETEKELEESAPDEPAPPPAQKPPPKP
jgi:phospholipid-binding lipoprotein MlaA